MRFRILVAVAALAVVPLAGQSAAVAAGDKPNYNVVPLAPECVLEGGTLKVVAKADMRTYTTTANPSKRANITNFVLRVRLEPRNGGTAGAWAASRKFPATKFKTPGNYTKQMTVTSSDYTATDDWNIHMQAVFVRSDPVPDLVKDFTTALRCPGLDLEPDTGGDEEVMSAT